MAETIVKIENLVKRYHELVAVDHFNLTVQRRNFRAFRAERFRKDNDHELSAVPAGIR